MQIDNPRLCTFWLEALVHGLPRASALELRLPLIVLQVWLWFYTFAAVPIWLRRTLVRNLRGVTAQLLGRARPEHWAKCAFTQLLRARLGAAGERECLTDRKHVRCWFHLWSIWLPAPLHHNALPWHARRSAACRRCCARDAVFVLML